MAQTVALPPPFQGQVDRVPLAALQHPAAQEVTNYNLDTGVAVLRKGDTTYRDIGLVEGFDVSNAGILHICSYGGAGGQTLIGVAAQMVGGVKKLRFFNLATGAVMYEVTL